MKKSQSIRLILIGGLSAGAVNNCGLNDCHSQSLVRGSVYTNNHQAANVGFYHAPYRGWYAYPYNYFDTQKQQYFHGGQWTDQPHQSITNISLPTPAMEQVVYPKPPPPTHTSVPHSSIPRSGFGSTSRHFSTVS